MSRIPQSEHKVYLYKDDFNAMCTEVYRHQDIETGGNLFGLWSTSGSAMIHIVLGPGQNCRRTNTSFHQDIDYMHRVGRFINDNYMLCHIGEWHSHHNLSLSRPSQGDELTIERNFPKGMSKFLVIIANIKNRDTIRLSPYFFTDGGTRYEEAEYVVLDSCNPFLGNTNITREIEMGSEESKRRQNRDANRGEIPSGDTGNHWNTRSNNSQRDANTGSTHSQVSKPHVTPRKPNSRHISAVTKHMGNSSAPESRGKRNNAFDSHENPSSPNLDHEEAMDTDDSDLNPPRDKSANTTTSPGNASPEPHKNVGDMNASARDVILMEVHDSLKKWFGSTPECMFKKENSNDRGVIEITFRHGGYFWMVRFPEDFPTKQAELYCARYRDGLHRYKCSFVAEPLNNKVNILLSIKKECGKSTSSEDVCSKFTKESLCLSDCNQSSWEKTSSPLKKLEKEIGKRLGDVTELSKIYLSDNYVEFAFKHDRYWIITFPALFPEVPAVVQYRYHKDSSQRLNAKWRGEYSNGPQALNSFELIIRTIHYTCTCGACYNTMRYENLSEGNT